jgi:hypothetical protein
MKILFREKSGTDFCMQHQRLYYVIPVSLARMGMNFGLSKGEGYIEGVLGQVVEENIGFLE